MVMCCVLTSFMRFVILKLREIDFFFLIKNLILFADDLVNERQKVIKDEIRKNLEYERKMVKIHI